MENLSYVFRGEEKLYCFIEACAVVFPHTSKNTVRSWLKSLNMPCVVPTIEERDYLKKKIPLLSGSFGLINHDCLVRLVEKRHEKTSQKLRSPFTGSITDVSANNSNETCSTPGSYAQVTTTVCSSTENRCPTATTTTRKNISTVSINNDACSTPVSNMQISTIVASSIQHPKNLGLVDYVDSSSEDECSNVFDTPPNLPVTAESPCLPETIIVDFEDDTLELVDVADAKNLPSTSSFMESPSKKRNRTKYQLKLDEVSPTLKAEIMSIRQFYTQPLNTKRDCTNFSPDTIKKMIERIMCFMFYCKKLQHITDLHLTLCNDEDIVSAYVSYLSNERDLMPSTIISILTVLINVVKFNLANNPSRLSNSPELSAYRRLQRQLSKEARLLSKRNKEGLGKKSSQQFYFAHILEVLRKLREKYFEEPNGMKKARYLHDFTMLATYLRAMPGRSHEIRSLKLHEESRDGILENYDSGNLIVFHEDQSVVLIENEFKTVKSTGPTKIDLTDDEELVQYLRKYMQVRHGTMRENNLVVKTTESNHYFK